MSSNKNKTKISTLAFLSVVPLVAANAAIVTSCKKDDKKDPEEEFTLTLDSASTEGVKISSSTLKLKTESIITFEVNPSELIPYIVIVKVAGLELEYDNQKTGDGDYKVDRIGSTNQYKITIYDHAMTGTTISVKVLAKEQVQEITKLSYQFMPGYEPVLNYAFKAGNISVTGLDDDGNIVKENLEWDIDYKAYSFYDGELTELTDFADTGYTFTSTDTIYFYFEYIGESSASPTLLFSLTPLEEPVHVESVELNYKTLTIPASESRQLVARVLPVTATDKSVVWSSSDETIVSVKNGFVTAIKPGTATITVTTNDGGKTDSCTITVPEVLEDSVMLSASSETLLQWTKVNDSELSYSTDGKNFNPVDSTITFGNTSTPVIYLKGKLTNTESKFNKIALTNHAGVLPTAVLSGSLMNLINNGEEVTDLPEYAFYGLFYNATGLVRIDETKYKLLPAKQLSKYCYEMLFYGCSNLVNAPELSSENLAESCYAEMFKCCEALENAPELPATVMQKKCYYFMFYKCTKLVKPPKLPADTMADGCYQGMFLDCYSLNEAPELPATTLAKWCYQAMFRKCTSLTTTPVLPAETLTTDCYNLMFEGCTSLTKISEIKCKQLSTYSCWVMFQGCTSLSINNTGETGTLFFTCPDTTPSMCVKEMFKDTAGPFTDDPVAGGKYYC